MDDRESGTAQPLVRLDDWQHARIGLEDDVTFGMVEAAVDERGDDTQAAAELDDRL